MRATKRKRAEQYPNGVQLSVYAERIKPPAPWPHDDSPDVRHNIVRAFERRGYGELGGGSGDAGVITIEEVDFHTRDVNQARKVIAELFRELAYGWKYKTAVVKR